ncbi:Cytokinesis regulator [Neofusicoccum parvum]|nr:Cytokinesis regulator [Neofusicoccum parvum]
MSPNVESWDDDADFHGDLFAPSASSHTGLSLSSRAPSLRSESVAGDEDWQVLLAPDDEASTKDAISSAKHAGIPIPTTVPSSALLGGTIKRLGKKPSRQKIHQDDDWADDLDLSGPSSGALKLKTPQPPATPSQDDDDFDDWAEGGSLGIRFGGTRRDTRTRGSSVSAAMSPSLGSCMTLESEDDDFGGLVLPKEPIDFNAMLRKRKEAETDDEKTPQPEPRPTQETFAAPEHPEEQEAPAEAAPPHPTEETATHPDPETQHEALAQIPSEPEPQSAPQPAPQQQPMPLATLKGVPEDDDFFADIEMGFGDTLDTGKLTMNRNIRVQSNKPATHTIRATTSLTFTDKPSVSYHNQRAAIESQTISPSTSQRL